MESLKFSKCCPLRGIVNPLHSSNIWNAENLRISLWFFRWVERIRRHNFSKRNVIFEMSMGQPLCQFQKSATWEVVVRNSHEEKCSSTFPHWGQWDFLEFQKAKPSFQEKKRFSFKRIRNEWRIPSTSKNIIWHQRQKFLILAILIRNISKQRNP